MTTRRGLGERLRDVPRLHTEDCSSERIRGRSCDCVTFTGFDAVAAEALAHVREVLTREAIARALASVQCWCGKTRAEHTHAMPHRYEGPGTLGQADAILALLDAAGT